VERPQRHVPELHLLGSVAQGGFRPVLHTYRMPFAGDPLASAQPVVIDRATGSCTPLAVEPLLVEFLSPLEIGWAWWGTGARTVWFLREERGATRLALRTADVDAGASREVIVESSDTYIEPHPLLPWMNSVRFARGESLVLWPSERDGRRHLYLFDAASGEMLRRLTSGDWIVRDVLHADDEWVWFTGLGREPGGDPYRRIVYRVALDGGEPERLTSAARCSGLLMRTASSPSPCATGARTSRVGSGRAPSDGGTSQMKAVRFDEYGGVDVLDVREVEDPVATPGRVVVAVKAAGINPGEIAVREGHLHERWPATFPSGQGSDFAGVVQSVGDGVTAVSPGDEVLGWTEERASHAELVATPADQLTSKPPSVPWEVAGALFVAATAGYASVQAVEPQPGETVVVSAAAGGVGSIASQLARRAGATVIGLASEPNHDWLRAHDIVPVTYGDGQEDRISAAAGGNPDALIDTFGGGYVDMAIGLGVPPGRINTIIDYDAIARLGVHGQGTHAIASAPLLGELVRLVADGSLEVPIARTFPLARVRDAFADLSARHTRGKIVLIP
jgi:NADPH:quinone reductase-like Zn-dependent oxidoreductase